MKPGNLDAATYGLTGSNLRELFSSTHTLYTADGYFPGKGLPISAV